MGYETIWLSVGILGQLLFTSRFIVQWLSSEHAGKSVVPVMFWYLSLLGGVTLFVYALHRQEPVFVVGQSFGVFIYLRNLVLIYRERILARQVVEHRPC
jgi:lipid-A-disaccharide synthase-like uncharacterized protein